MSILSSLTELNVGRVIINNNQPYQVIWSNFMRTAQRKPVMQTKLKNLITGQVMEYGFKAGEKVEEADVERHKGSFLYKTGDELYFMDSSTYDQFSLPLDSLGGKDKFLKEGMDVDVMYFDGKPVSVSLPNKVTLKIVETPEGAKGDTATGGSKQATLETGVVINVPLFLKEGEEIIINTETENYVERANK